MIVETGNGVVGANSYLSVADAEPIVGSVSEEHLIKATRYLDSVYGSLYRGYRAHAEQGLLWPRVYAVDTDGFALCGVPRRLKEATAEVALMISQGQDLYPDSIKSEEVTVGPIRTKTEFQSGSAELPKIEAMMEMLIKSGKVRRG